MAPQIWSKTCLKYHFLGEQIEILIYYLQNIAIYKNLVDIGEILPMAPQIWSKTCLKYHFLGEQIEILIYSLQNIAIYDFKLEK